MSVSIENTVTFARDAQNTRNTAIRELEETRSKLLADVSTIESLLDELQRDSRPVAPEAPYGIPEPITTRY